MLSGHNSTSQGDLISRLRSFNATTWFGKPSCLGAAECARKGWTNSGPDQLTCLSCGSQILCKLPLNPWSESAANVVDQYAQRLLDAHSQQCRQRSLLLAHQQQEHAASAQQSSSPSFPIVPTEKLSASYFSRLHELQRLQSLPHVAASTRAQLAVAAALLDPSILSGLAAILHVPADSLKHEAATAITTGSSARAATPAGDSQQLPQDQAHALIALCGWQVKQLLPSHLAPSAADNNQSSVFGLAHLLGRPSGAATAAGNTAAGSISASCCALECELCGSEVGLWRFSCSGPFYAQQLSSKAMKTLAAATASTATAAQHNSASAGQITLTTTAGPGAAAAGVGSAAKPGSASPAAQQQAGQQQASAGATASPEAVFTAMTHTIAGGSLMNAGAAGAAAASTPAGMVAMGSASSGGPFGQKQQQQQQAPVFGGTAQPVFGSPFGSPPPRLGTPGRPPLQQQSPAASAAAAAAGSGGSKLFEGLQGAPAASVFGSPPPASAGVSGPFGGGGGSGEGDEASAAAPVFGLKAFQVEEQRVKRRRSSATGPEFAVAAAAAAAAHAGESPHTAAAAGGAAGAATGAEASAAAAEQRTGTPETQAVVTAAGASGGASGGRMRSYSKQKSGLVAAAAAATGNAAASGDACFDPVSAHRSWCPWVVQQQQSAAAASNGTASTAAGSSSSKAGLVAAVRLGWSATVMAVQETLDQQELNSMMANGGAGGAEVVGSEAGFAGLTGYAMQRDDYSSTAAVLARARQTMDMLDGLP